MVCVNVGFEDQVHIQVSVVNFLEQGIGGPCGGSTGSGVIIQNRINNHRLTAVWVAHQIGNGVALGMEKS